MRRVLARGRDLPRELTDRMVNDFIASSEVVCQVTKPAEYFEFKKGIYAYLVVKPIRRIARLLTTDRELLVLFSSFDDQQPRTIEAAIDLIDKSDGRLENSLAIVVHNDPEGNLKLKKWGREKGLSIIPISAQNPVPSGEELERTLFSEFFSNDVFDVSGPVSDDARFYGRRSEAIDLARQLQTGQVRSSLGIRKIGKTSIIHRVLDVVHAGHDCSSVMIDCSRDAVWTMNSAQLISAISLAVVEAATGQDRYASIHQITEELELGAAVEQLLGAIRGSRRPVLIFFDEVDYITPGGPAADQWKQGFNVFWRNLRAVYQEAMRMGAILSLFVSGVSSKWFRVESIEGVENASLAFIPEEYLSPLPSGASVAMIRALARTAGLQFDDNMAGHIADACSNMPYWIRKACSYIHRNIPVEHRPHKLSMDETISLTQTFIGTEGAAIAEVALSHLFRVYPELEPLAVAIHQGAEQSTLATQCHVLERYGVVSRNDTSCRMHGQMMSQGMRAYLDSKVSRPTREVDGLEFSSINEWAEELALLNASRNKIEKRLRGIVVNFLRFDSLQKKQKYSLAERVAQCIEPSRREKLRPLTPDEIVEKFYWTDLTRLIEMEWTLFHNLFSDKSLFREHSRTVNQRLDAHAKDADKADVAQYRRALEWFNECLART